MNGGWVKCTEKTWKGIIEAYNPYFKGYNTLTVFIDYSDTASWLSIIKKRYQILDWPGFSKPSC